MTAAYRHPIHIYAHRGANRIFPENTIAAFKHAVKQGATHLEMDVHRTVDGHIVVAHDNNAKRTANEPRLIKESKLNEVQSWNVCAKFPSLIPKIKLKECYIPTLLEVLEAIPSVPFNIDIKDPHPQVTQQIIHLLHKTNNAKRILLTSFSAKVIKNLRDLSYQGPIGLSKWAVLQATLFPSVFWKLFHTQGQAMQIPPRWKRIQLDRKYIINRCHARGYRVDYWVINEPEKALALLHAGADGITTDDVDAVRVAITTFAKKHSRKLMRP